MNKTFISIFLLLGIAFLGITYFKYASDTGPITESKTDTGKKERSAVFEFWKYYRQATDFRTAGNYPQASEYYSRALAIDSTHLNALYYKGNMHLVLHNFKDAEGYWKRMIRLNSASARAYIQLGTLYSCRNASYNPLYDPGKAADHFMKAMELNLEITGPLLQMAKIDLIHNRLEPASRKLDDVVSSNFRSVEGRFLQGYLAWKKNEPQQATSLFDQAATILRGDDARFANVGEGETKSGEEQLEMEIGQCNLFSGTIDQLLNRYVSEADLNMEEIYKTFDKEVATHL